MDMLVFSTEFTRGNKDPLLRFYWPCQGNKHRTSLYCNASQYAYKAVAHFKIKDDKITKMSVPLLKLYAAVLAASIY